MKMNFNRILMLVMASVLSLSLSAQHGKYVGGDISMLLQYEEHNSPYLDGNNQPIGDLIKWLKNECGWNTFRVRLFVNPDSSNDPAVCQDLDYVMQLGKRIKDAGAYFMLDYHYSDTWVDATHIQAPRAWKNCTVDQKADSIAAYTRSTLQAMIDAGAIPDMVQVGNEIMYGFMGIKVHPYQDTNDDWAGFLKILKAGCDAVREKVPTAQIIIHTDRLANQQYNKYYYGKLIDNQVDFDVIGLSYYPFWHGYLKDLKTGLDGIKRDFPDKRVQIVETGYYFQYWPSSGVNYQTKDTWAATADGQYNFVRDLVDFLKDYDQVDGLSYWNPEDAGNGDDTNWTTHPKGTVSSYWTNRGLWIPNQSTTGHRPVKSSKGLVHYVLKDFLAEITNGVENTPIDIEQPTKIIKDGRLCIVLPDGTCIDAQGNRVH